VTDESGMAAGEDSHPFGLASGQAVHVAVPWPLAGQARGPLAGWGCGAAQEMASDCV
jgi:hypothetical protein